MANERSANIKNLGKYKASARGKRGLFVTLPQVWVKEVGLQIGSVILVSTDEKNRLVIEKG